MGQPLAGGETGLASEGTLLGSATRSPLGFLVPILGLLGGQQRSREDVQAKLGDKGSKLATQTGQRAGQIAASMGVTGGAGASFVAGREEGVRKDTALASAQLGQQSTNQDFELLGALASLGAFLIGGPGAGATVGAGAGLLSSANKARGEAPGTDAGQAIRDKAAAREAAGPQVAAPQAASITSALGPGGPQVQQGPGGPQIPQGPGGEPAIPPELLQQALPLLGNLSMEQLQLILTLLSGKQGGQ